MPQVKPSKSEPRTREAVLPWVQATYGVDIDPKGVLWTLAHQRAVAVLLMSQEQIEQQIILTKKPGAIMEAYEATRDRKKKGTTTKNVLAGVVFARTLKDDGDVPMKAIAYLGWAAGFLDRPSAKGDPVATLKKQLQRVRPFYVPLPQTVDPVSQLVNRVAELDQADRARFFVAVEYLRHL